MINFLHVHSYSISCHLDLIEFYIKAISQTSSHMFTYSEVSHLHVVPDDLYHYLPAHIVSHMWFCSLCLTQHQPVSDQSAVSVTFSWIISHTYCCRFLYSILITHSVSKLSFWNISTIALIDMLSKVCGRTSAFSHMHDTLSQLSTASLATPSYQLAVSITVSDTHHHTISLTTNLIALHTKSCLSHSACPRDNQGGKNASSLQQHL